MILYFYDETGRVNSKRSGSADNLAPLLSDPNVLCVESSADLPLAEVLVKDDELISVGPKPSAGYELNLSSAQWEYSLSIAKEEKWLQIKFERDAAEFSQFQWSDYAFDCNEVSQRRLQGAVQLAAINPDMTLDWTLADNSVQTFSAEEYVQIGQALANHVSQCHERGRILRQEIAAATTQEDLEAISW